MNQYDFIVRGMTCEGCMRAVTQALLSLDGVQHAVVAMPPDTTVVKSSKALRQDVLNDALKKIGGYSIEAFSDPDKTPKVSDMEIHSELVPEASRLSRYKPLLLIVGFLIGITSVLAWKNGWTWMDWMRYFMAGFFLVFSFFKFLDLKGFAQAYAGYDLLAKRLPAYGYVYPFLELGLGIALLIVPSSNWIWWAVLILMAFSSLGVIRSVRRKQAIQCACLGTVFDLPMSTVTIVEDVGMTLMAAAMLLWA